LKEFLKAHLDRTTLRYFIVGCINCTAGYAVAFVLYNFCGVNDWVANGANYFVAAVISYVLNKYYTFGVKERDMKYVLRFALVNIISFVLAYGAAKPLMLWLLAGRSEKLQENVAILVSLFIFVPLVYFGQRHYVFRKDKNGKA